MNNVEAFDELYNINTMTTQKGSFFRAAENTFEDKELKELSLGAKVLYAFMCDRIGLSVKMVGQTKEAVFSLFILWQKYARN